MLGLTMCADGCFLPIPVLFLQAPEWAALLAESC
jgi:hypothetical protein